jgi:hypothetical protein
MRRPRATRQSRRHAPITAGTENTGPAEIHCEDHGSGTPAVLSHGHLLSGTA